jgi:hypothetical protein
MKEARDIASGRVPSKSYSSFRETLSETIADDAEE